MIPTALIEYMPLWSQKYLIIAGSIMSTLLDQWNGHEYSRFDQEWSRTIENINSQEDDSLIVDSNCYYYCNYNIVDACYL